MIGFIASKSLRAINNDSPVVQRLLVTRYEPHRAEKGESLDLESITELLGIPLIGVIPESPSVLTSTNLGQPVISLPGDNAAEAYKDAVSRFLGDDVPMRFTKPEDKGFFSRLFGSS